MKKIILLVCFMCASNVYGYSNLITNLENISFTQLSVTAANTAEYVSSDTALKAFRSNEFDLEKNQTYRMHLIASGYSDVGFYNHQHSPLWAALVVDGNVYRHLICNRNIEFEAKGSKGRLYVYGGGSGWGTVSLIVEKIDTDTNQANYALLGLAGVLCAFMFWGVVNDAFLR